MKSRYGLLPVGMARIRVKVSPKMISHRAGWIAREYSSARSWLIFATSTQQNVTTRLNSRPPHLGRRPSAQATGCGADCADIPEPPSLVVEVRAGEAAEDVLQGR